METGQRCHSPPSDFKRYHSPQTPQENLQTKRELGDMGGIRMEIDQLLLVSLKRVWRTNITTNYKEGQRRHLEIPYNFPFCLDICLERRHH